MDPTVDQLVNPMSVPSTAFTDTTNTSSDPTTGSPLSEQTSEQPSEETSVEASDETSNEIHTCANLDNEYVYSFLTSRSMKSTSEELISYECGPPGLTPKSFHYHLSNLKKDYQRLQKSRYKSEEHDHEFRSFAHAAFVYPSLEKREYQSKSFPEKNLVGDENTFAKVAWELGGELHAKKKEIKKIQIRHKRKVEVLQERVDEAKQENKNLSNELGAKDADYKR